jgi:serine/threonine protein phosphatase PrpC
MDSIATIACPHCQTEADPDDRFCEACGAALDGVSQPADPPTRPVGGERRKTCRCPRGSADPDEDGFCRTCGFRVAAAPSPDEPSLAHAIDAGLAAISDPGRRHRITGSVNQDAALCARFRDGSALLVVADGVSSSSGAEAASAAAVAALRYVLESADSDEVAADTMRRAIAAAHAAVRALEIVEPDPDKDPPETTIVAALVRRDIATIGWVGDSRAYLVAGREGRALTRDDSWMAEVVAAGAMTLDEARADRRAHAITQCLGMADMEIDVHVDEVPIEHGAWLVLCSDGLWNYLDDGMDLAVALAGMPLEADALERCRRLTKHANDSGGHDNISVVMLQIG